MFGGNVDEEYVWVKIEVAASKFGYDEEVIPILWSSTPTSTAGHISDGPRE